MNILVLGSAAGGGFPQWNCNCPNCALARSGSPRAKPRTQSSIAVSEDGERWLLLNASPDIRQQINQNESLFPKNGARHSPISSVILTNADVDHIAGLLTLRERQRFILYATERVQSVLKANSVFNVLNEDFVDRQAFSLQQELALMDVNGEALGLTVDMFPVPGKVALFLEDESAGDNFGSVPEDTVGLYVSSTSTGKGFYYLPGCAALPDSLKSKLKGADLVLMDGTTWVNHEMEKTGVGEKTSQRMGHMSMSGPEGSMAAFHGLEVKKKVYIHMNNTNPVLIEGSPEHTQATSEGWTIAEDGMTFSLE